MFEPRNYPDGFPSFRLVHNSSNVRGIGFDEEFGKLFVLFRSDSLYVYYGVPRETAVAFVQSGSKGTYLNQHIKGTYNYARLF